LYGERGRTQVFEPTGRLTRFLPNGHVVSLTLGLDTITGASPTGAIPTTEIHTTTTASGRVRTSEQGIVPTSSFQDSRGSADLAWQAPLPGGLATSIGGHVSSEKDYRSKGADAKLSVPLMQRLATITVGGGYRYDEVDPTGGTRVPFTSGTIAAGHAPNPKRVSTAVLGVSRILTRRWMVALDATRIYERGYLTDPYKVVSQVNPETGDPVGELSERRPSTRDRRDVMASSVYHSDTGIVYASDRWYWDDWGVHSNTMDLKYRHVLDQYHFLEPHLRYYAQSRADFFRYSLPVGTTLPEFASSDQRLGSLQSFTLGGTYGIKLPGRPGEWRVRLEYTRQWGQGHPQDAIGNQRSTDLSPPVDTGSAAVLYTLRF
ncbi:MAG: DUF3570 domain-containing protein, partial [Candidatus Eisenbacteria bacterium]|nr:DUF3570 domain-containing protein [Candidatus Eisenbacteria bacterium]